MQINMKEFFKKNDILILILLISLGLSLFYSFHFRIKPVVDAQAYDSIGWNMAQGFGYRQTAGSNLVNDSSITRVGPLYELFLAGIYKIFGHHYQPVWIAQAILHAVSAWLVYLTALLVFNNSGSKKKIGLWAAAIFGFYPDLIEISAMILTETFYLFLVCLAIYLFFLYLYKQNYLAVAVLALVTGLAALARPPVLLFVPIVLFYLYKNLQKEENVPFNKRKSLLHAVIFLLILLAVFAPWTARNYIVFQKFMPFGAAGAFNFWIGNYHGGNGEQEPTMEQAAYAGTHSFRDLQDESIQQFKIFLTKYPAEFLKLTLLRINKYFSVIRPMGFWFYQSGLGQFLFILSSAVSSVVIFITGFGGLVRSFKLKSGAIYYLFAFLIATPLFVFVTVVETRYRFQIYPILAIFAGFFIVTLLEKKKFWLDKVLWSMAAVFFANGLLDAILSLGRLKERLGKFI